MTKPRTPYLVPPRYDIDTLLDVDRTARFVADKIVDELWGAIDGVPKSAEQDFYRPDSVLLPPEVTLRDFCMFNTSMGNGWVVSLGYSGGLLCFFRGLRALRTIRHARGLAMAETVMAALNRRGIPDLATAFADDPFDGWREEFDFEATLERFWDIEDSLDEEIGWKGLGLDREWWRIDRTYWDRHQIFASDDPPLSYRLCEHLDENRRILQSRNCSNVA